VLANKVPPQYPGDPILKIVLEEPAIKHDGNGFTDHDVHRFLRGKGFLNPKGEWFKCTVKDVKVAIVAIQENKLNEENRTLNFKMRPEQKVAVDLTASYFRNNPRTAESKTPPFPFGMQKCVLGKPSLLTNSPKK